MITIKCFATNEDGAFLIQDRPQALQLIEQLQGYGVHKISVLVEKTAEALIYADTRDLRDAQEEIIKADGIGIVINQPMGYQLVTVNGDYSRVFYRVVTIQPGNLEITKVATP